MNDTPLYEVIEWDGPRADWDHANELDEFVAWLDQYNPGWR